ncbi:ribosomal protein S18-alanine N-acetyltransferase [Lachnoclostridium phytofermentans]|uniref:[Ribosomal protein bS18]-alanine N-acetyltransferase n=1 Tax=Lachnoclostridium phytofermentans (strain ATCC 700394 / DSM 18823 / ISDg) TaxID=357809 RepID=A9KSU1_LACP7|nr:ribosomal protein S18-alanine N-acetyltransferase [Lachnoclostridium phytofermentans]ABX40735.1 ribosomal-protein-alanine acetyltransferase [Lachnoclostridium phytofermentans ISDg]
MIIRKMLPNDSKAMAIIEQETFSDPWSEESFLKEATEKDHIYLVVEDSGNLIAYCGMWNITGEGYITNVCVKKEKRKQGIGKLMLVSLLEQAKLCNIEAVTLEVRESNQSAIHLYEQLGFQSVGKRKDFYAHPTEDAIIMWLNF